jgi:hypothetical protein
MLTGMIIMSGSDADVFSLSSTHECYLANASSSLLARQQQMGHIRIILLCANFLLILDFSLLSILSNHERNLMQ